MKVVAASDANLTPIGIGSVWGAPSLSSPGEGVTITTDFGHRTYG